MRLIICCPSHCFIWMVQKCMLEYCSDISNFRRKYSLGFNPLGSIFSPGMAIDQIHVMLLQLLNMDLFKRMSFHHVMANGGQNFECPIHTQMYQSNLKQSSHCIIGILEISCHAFDIFLPVQETIWQIADQ